MLVFKEIHADPVTKVQDLKEPITGVYKGKEGGLYSPLFLIETNEGVKKIAGVIDLQLKMEKVKPGSTVKIGLKEQRTTDNGNLQYVTTVQVGEEKQTSK